MFVISENADKYRHLKEFYFNTEGTENISPQIILAAHPEILLSTEGLNVAQFEEVVSVREYQTSRGAIDIVFITDRAELFLVETKLLKNPEAHRIVVAQAIDYAKAFSEEEIDTLKDKIKKLNLDLNIFKNREYYEAILQQNIANGNYQVLIVGDNIHPNILGMMESIQSAPHLSFTLNAISLNPHKLNEDEIILNTRIESRTIEIERSVISIEISRNGEIKIDSSVPDKKRKGNKPRITEETYFNNLEDADYLEAVRKVCKEIRKRNGTIEWGTVGFSAGYYSEKRRISLIWVYDSWFNILTEKVRRSYGISDDIYHSYLNTLKESEYIYERIIVPNKAAVNFKDIDLSDFDIVISATLKLMDELTKENS